MTFINMTSNKCFIDYFEQMFFLLVVGTKIT